MSDEKELRERLRALVTEARDAGAWGALSEEWRALCAAPRTSGTADALPGRFGMIGASPQMEAVFDLLEKVAPSNVSVLILGETGTGKEYAARAIHDGSDRRERAFVAENCAAVPANLLESELFGHVRGAFTGAVADRAGHFVVADKGTVFLDEIGDMPLAMQSKLLRVLQDGEVRPVGSNKVKMVDVRVVAATNKDLTAMCAERTFREDLFFRLNVITIDLPPLREREGDIALLTRHFLARVGEELGRELTLDGSASATLEAWNWPGNVRELENEICRAAVLSGDTISAEDLSPRLLKGV
jgi:transcriptional regulator with GAF, ATPase, and Fis domain